MSGLSGLKDWQAAIVGYFAAILIAGTEAAPLAVAGSWGIAIFMLLDQASGGQTLGSLINNVQTAAGQPGQSLANTPPSQVSGAGGPATGGGPPGQRITALPG